jgi:hypothetical protein
MQKKQDLQNSFKSRKEKTVMSVDDIDRIAEQVEKPTIVAQPIVVPIAKPVQAVQIIEEEGTETIKTSLDFPVSVYEDMRISLFKKRRSMKDYIVDLVRKDLYGSK